jgi:hypothetical protein
MDEINKLFNLTGLDVHAVASGMFEYLVENSKETMPDIPASYWDKYRNSLETESLYNNYVAIYKRHYTDEEIADLIKFYESPLGSKSVKANQQITQETQANAQVYFESLGKAVATELLTEDS